MKLKPYRERQAFAMRASYPDFTVFTALHEDIRNKPVADLVMEETRVVFACIEHGRLDLEAYSDVLLAGAMSSVGGGTRMARRRVLTAS